jgi:hypothetical protein
MSRTTVVVAETVDGQIRRLRIENSQLTSIEDVDKIVTDYYPEDEIKGWCAITS